MSVERQLGEILANQENHTGWLKSIDKKVEAHVATPHADVAEVKTNTRWRWMAMGIIAVLSTGLAIAGLVL
jgi:hypothetical protein